MTTIEEVPLRLIDVGSNVRIDPGELGELAATIEEFGVLQPVKVTPTGSGRYTLVFGQRRVLAARQAGLTTIPAMVAAPDAGLGSNGTRRSTEQLVENLHRKGLNPIEEAEALRAILAGHSGLTQVVLAKQLGRTGAWLSNILRILDLHPTAQDLLRRGEIAESTARALLPLPAARQGRMAQRAIRDGWSTRQAEREVSRVLHPPAKREQRGRPRLIELPAEGERRRSVRLPVATPEGTAVITIAIEGRGFVDLIVQDPDGQRVRVTLKAADARLLGRRLGQAYQAVVA